MTSGQRDQSVTRADVPGGDGLGAVLARRRVHKGLSQLELAQLLCEVAGVFTLTRHEISRWEREERIPSSSWLGCLSETLDVPLAVLRPLAEVARDSRDTTKSTCPESARARAANADILVIMKAPAVATDPATLAERTAVLRRMDDLVGGADLADLVLAQLQTAGTAADPRPGPSTPPDPYAAPTADLAQLATWVLADAGRHAAATETSKIGLRAAMEAGDQAMAVYLAGCLAESRAEAGETARTLRLARTAASTSAVPSGVRALAMHRLAYTAALAGHRGEAEEMLASAERERERHGSCDDPPWLYWLDELHTAVLAGRCYVALGRPRMGRPLLADALRELVRPREQSICGAWLAMATADVGKLDSACDITENALVAAVRSGSVRAARLVRVVDARLRRAPEHPAVRGFAARSETACAYLADIRPATPSGAGASG